MNSLPEIESVEVAKVDFPLEEPFEFGSQVLEQLPYALVRIELEDGTIGLGECPAYWDTSGETGASARGIIEVLGDQFTGLKPSESNRAEQIWERNAREAYCARAGVNMAMLDALGKCLKVPVSELIGGGSYDVRTPMIIGLKSKDDASDRIENYQGNLWKLKAGDLTEESERERFREVYNLILECCDNPQIAIDANQEWKTPRKANRCFEFLKKIGCDPCWVEQPIETGNVNNWRKIPGSVMADESQYSVRNAVQLMENGVDLINIKLAKSAGLTYSGKVVDEVERRNREFVVGSMIESPVGALAAYHFSRAYDSIWNEAIWGLDLIEGYSSGDYFKVGPRGQVTLSDSVERAGLGVKPSDIKQDVDWKSLK